MEIIETSGLDMNVGGSEGGCIELRAQEHKYPGSVKNKGRGHLIHNLVAVAAHEQAGVAGREGQQLLAQHGVADAPDDAHAFAEYEQHEPKPNDETHNAVLAPHFHKVAVGRHS